MGYLALLYYILFYSILFFLFCFVHISSHISRLKPTWRSFNSFKTVLIEMFVCGKYFLCCWQIHCVDVWLYQFLYAPHWYPRLHSYSLWIEIHLIVSSIWQIQKLNISCPTFGATASTDISIRIWHIYRLVIGNNDNRCRCFYNRFVDAMLAAFWSKIVFIYVIDVPKKTPLRFCWGDFLFLRIRTNKSAKRIHNHIYYTLGEECC